VLWFWVCGGDRFGTWAGVVAEEGEKSWFMSI
jgi:hypothetical protein